MVAKLVRRVQSNPDLGYGKPNGVLLAGVEPAVGRPAVDYLALFTPSFSKAGRCHIMCGGGPLGTPRDGIAIGTGISIVMCVTNRVRVASSVRKTSSTPADFRVFHGTGRSISD